MSKGLTRAEKLFAVERDLRSAAMTYASWHSAGNINGKNGKNEARRSLRVAALAYAAAANEIELLVEEP